MGVKVVRPGDRQPDVGSGAMAREAAVSNSVCGAEKIWVGYVELPAGLRSAKHHHGEAESAIYVISGHARFLTGPEGKDVHDAGPGDFVWVPPHEHHVEMNLSESEPVRMVVSRSTQETLVFNVD
ncbi:MAG: cupin domain-containing protein [Chloroflexi bacterium]|nr:MAG: cupin domain-containing protein [Chloroflexota bacterium]TMD52962.1 MAG: cupin domain-containing protein [Chloroflexota bacterium]